MTEERLISPAIQRAHSLLAVGRPEEALRELATLPAAESISGPAFFLRCAAHLQLERWAEAAEAARHGLAAGGPHPGLLRMLAEAERELGNLETAERAVLDGLALDPHDVDLLCSYARLCLSVGQLDKAGKLVERALAQEPHAPGVYATRVHLAYARGDDRAAQKIAREFVAHYPENAAAHALLGGMSAMRGQVKAADSGMRQAVAADPMTVSYAEAAMETKIARHPLMLPVRPFVRFGPIKTWIAAIAIIYGLRMLRMPVLSFVFAMGWIGLCVYSWVVPPLVRRWMTRRWRA